MDSLAIALINVVLVLTGKVLVALVSLGQWRGERLTKDEARIYGPAGALSFVRDGQRVVTALGLSVVGHRADPTPAHEAGDVDDGWRVVVG
ncbi:MAG: hypothetical protein JSS14_29390 [Proteobacteria bacterium]|nr:hypothetical protein [Pseudomonadota bacterium]